MKKVIGILGGMGPEATAHMHELIIRKTKVEKDQDHISMVIMNNPKIHPRSDAIFGIGPDPTPQLIDGVRLLLQAGADFIIIPCVTAHYFHPGMAAEMDFPFISLLDESALWVKRHLPDVAKAGLLCSTGTLDSRIFHDAFARVGISVIGPDEEGQKRFEHAVMGTDGIKAGFTSGPPREAVLESAVHLIDRGAQAIVAGCTEIPLVLDPKDITVPLIDPMEIIAETSIRVAGYEVKE